MNSKADIRQMLDTLPYVSRTWLEWSRERDIMVKTLVVEVSFDTDPNDPGHNSMAMEEIEGMVTDYLVEATMMIAHLKIVPKVHT